MSGLYKMFFGTGERSSCGPDSVAFYTLCFGEELFPVAQTTSLGRATFRSWTTYSATDKAGKNSAEVLRVLLFTSNWHIEGGIW